MSAFSVLKKLAHEGRVVVLCTFITSTDDSVLHFLDDCLMAILLKTWLYTFIIFPTSIAAIMLPSRTPLSLPRKIRHITAAIDMYRISKKILTFSYLRLNTLLIARFIASPGSIATEPLSCIHMPSASITQPRSMKRNCIG